MSAAGTAAGSCQQPVSDSPTLEQIRQSAQVLWDEGKVEESWEFLLTALGAALDQKRALELLLAQIRKQQVGKRSERIDPAQMRLMFEELCSELGEDAEIDPKVEEQEDQKLNDEIKAAEEAKPERAKKKRKRRGTYQTKDVKVEVHQVEVPENERQCSKCGGDKQRIGEDVTRTLEYVPAHFIEHEFHKEKYACGKCKDGVTTAPGPEKVIERSSAGASVLADVVVCKYTDHCPLCRIHRIYERSGVTIPVSTLSDWVADVGRIVQPVVDVLGLRVLRAYVIRTDATGLKVLDPEALENIVRGFMWVYVGDDRDVLFRYAPTGEGALGPWDFLAGRTGYIQADAASVFDRLYNGLVASAIEVGCWSHARRGLVALKDTDCRVAYPLKLITRMYRIETLADVKELTFEDRAQMRMERTVPILTKLKHWLVGTQLSEPPKTALSQAVGYILNQWEPLNRFTQDGRLSLDNNIGEQQMRDIALGRKNYLFAGSHEAAHRAAGIYSLTRTCAQYGVNPRLYLTDLLRKLSGGWPQSRLEELLPHNWPAFRPTS